ncbi:DUF1127 domain-containing protein [uncultured Paracoccus sp.]|uniref:DUF1127 domain-containing protein n=1 Tax=uncultured Paracoccus sp. TaxID=189685 RepID=UPI00262F319C|nr:DUF1127 domain-containing protein [uncultured Paracoccus sp.]
MSAIDTLRAPVGAFSGVGLNLAAMVASWRDVRRTRAALNRLSDRELKDIGLTRGDIDQVARRGR